MPEREKEGGREGGGRKGEKEGAGFFLCVMWVLGTELRSST